MPVFEKILVTLVMLAMAVAFCLVDSSKKNSALFARYPILWLYVREDGTLRKYAKHLLVLGVFIFTIIFWIFA